MTAREQIAQMPEPLKSCPFCGGAARIVRATLIYVTCDALIDCAVRPHTFGTDVEAEAIARWNRRASPPSGRLMKPQERVHEDE